MAPSHNTLFEILINKCFLKVNQFTVFNGLYLLMIDLQIEESFWVLNLPDESE